jgi:glucose-6-phosphate isomerase
MSAKRWLVGLRRAWSLSGAIDRWVEDRGVTGVVYTPSGYDADDLTDALSKLVASGARPDKALLWDLALEDIRIAADVLRDAYNESQTFDGYVTVWIDPARSNDPDKAVAAAADVIGDVRRANVALGMAWTPQRAAVVERLVSSDVPLALSAVRDRSALDNVVAARSRGMEKRRATAAKTDPDAEVPEVPIFLLGGEEGADNVYPVALLTEFDLFREGAPTGRLPLAPDAEMSAFTAAAERLTARAKQPPHDTTFSPDLYAGSVNAELNELEEDEVLEDVWARDHTIWKEDPTDIADRLGWLDVVERMWDERKQIAEFARRTRSSCEAKHIVLLGMGGSSLGAETLVSSLAASIPLTVLDTTHPDHVESVRSSLDLDHTIFVVGSKSGTTIETRAHLEYFWSLVPRGDRFVAITDPGSELAKLASDRGFTRVFENPPDIGGRYSVLSYFGLIPAALCGVDIDPVLSSARRAMVHNAPGAYAPDASGTRLGAALAQGLRTESRDKLTLFFPPQVASLGDWIEQLIAESTGKEQTGMLPVVGEPFASPEFYGDDRVLCLYTLAGEAIPPQLEALEDQPLIRIALRDVRDLGAEFYRWEMATAILGYLLDINPFDQPDVEAAKVRAREALTGAAGSRPDAGDARSLLTDIAPPSYVAIQAFVAPTPENAAKLEAVRVRLRDRYKVATTLGFGPRYLHSTGQFHKGGPATGVFLQVTDERTTDIEVPGLGFSFGKLIDAQADGDLLALRDLGRGVARVSLASIEAISQE